VSGTLPAATVLLCMTANARFERAFGFLEFLTWVSGFTRRPVQTVGKLQQGGYSDE